MFFATALIPGKVPGIVVKDYISQSGFFVICCFLLLELAEQAWISKRVVLCSSLVALMAAFLIDITYVATSRTALVVLPALLLLFGLRRNWKIAVSACALWAGLFLMAWDSSPYLQHRLESAFSTAANDNQLDAVSNRQRLAYWEASIDLIKQAPLVGHGTGSIRGIFQHYTAAGPDSEVNRVANPHNQTFVVALQLGIIGTIALYGMWFAHARLFWQPGIAAWFGLVVVVQNFVSSLMNSHLSDFTQGWTYAICVGVAGGMVQRRSSLSTADSGQYTAAAPELVSVDAKTKTI
jgi:O-antigen ligase